MEKREWRGEKEGIRRQDLRRREKGVDRRVEKWCGTYPSSVIKKTKKGNQMLNTLNTYCYHQQDSPVTKLRCSDICERHIEIRQLVFSKSDKA